MNQGTTPQVPPERPALAKLAPLCTKYPSQAAALVQTWEDLKYSAGWTQLSTVDIERATSPVKGYAPKGFGSQGWVLICGRPRGAKSNTAVLPMLVEETMDTALFSEVFARLPNEVAPTHVLLAMMSNDATVVYYKLSQGLVKPVN